MDGVRLTTMRGFKVNCLWLMVEAGPPVIWIPRLGRTRFATNYETWFEGVSFGLGWWIFTVGCARRLEASPSTEATPSAPQQGGE